jgi:hypothetical protein
MATTNRLKVGDKVMWRGAWGTEPAKEVTVESMQQCPQGSKYGKDIKSANWTVVMGSRKILVDLDNGHWAYGNQLSPIKK